MPPPLITHISNEVRVTQGQVPYAQQIATMSDGSQWEVPTIGNGNIWRKIGKSHTELQADFQAYYRSIMEPQPINDKNKKRKT